MNVVLLDAQNEAEYGLDLEQKIFAAHGIRFTQAKCHSRADVLSCCGDADVILSVSTPVDGAVLDAAPHCRGLVRYGIGYDVFDLEAANRHGVAVCNIPDYCFEEVAAHTMTLLLAASRQLYRYTQQVKAGLWNLGTGSFSMHRPSVQTLGLLGFGNIARTVARYAKPFGYTLVAYDPFLPDETFLQCGVQRVTLDQLLEMSDLISCHTPLTEGTYHLLNREAFLKMKQGVILVNTSRGAIIQEDALIEALQNGRVAAAGLDVLESEPLTRPDHPLALMDQVILTPHAAFDSDEAAHALHTRVAETAVALASGDLPRNTVNREYLLKNYRRFAAELEE